MAKRARTAKHEPSPTDKPLVVSYADGEVEQWPLSLLQTVELLQEGDSDEEDKGTLDCSQLDDRDDSSDNDCHEIAKRKREDNTDEKDIQCSELKCGILRPRLPRASYLFPGLESRPVWPLEAFSEVGLHLEREFPVLREEVLRLLPANLVYNQSTGSVVANEENPNSWEHQGEGLHSGIWQKLSLFSGGKSVNAGQVAAPRLHACLQALLGSARARGFARAPMMEEAPGRAYLSLMLPNTRVKVHCGPTNHRLRLHLPLLVPRQPKSVLGMRLWHESHGKLHTTTLRWKEGKCFIIDDSFPHEVWYRSFQPSPPLKQHSEQTVTVPLDQVARVVLVLDLWHPQCKFGPSHISKSHLEIE